MRRDDKSLELIRTADGSYSILNKLLGETYHSRHGALTESLHVFLEMGFASLGAVSKLRILEVGYGTGLNAWLTANRAETEVINTHYTALEPFPPDNEFCLKPETHGNTPEAMRNWIKLMGAPWGASSQINEQFCIEKLQLKIEDYHSAQLFDLVYFDAFAPGYQPEIWEAQVFEKIYFLLNQGGILVTYCAKSSVKRNMKQAGYLVETLPGPPGKREMTRARKI